MKFAERLVRLRLDLPLRDAKEVAKKEVANEAGVNIGSYSLAENGVVPGEKILTRIAKYFNVSVGYLLGKEPAQGAPVREKPPKPTPLYKEQVSEPDEAAQGELSLGEQFMEDVNYLKIIYDYKDLGIISAIHANLKTFNRTVQREIEVRQLKTRIDRLEEAVRKLMADREEALAEKKSNSRGA